MTLSPLTRLRCAALATLMAWLWMPSALAIGLHTKSPMSDLSPMFVKSLDLISTVDEAASPATVAEVFADLVAHPQFSRMPGRHRNAVLTRAGYAAGAAGRFEQARDWSMLATQIDPDQPYLWYRLALFEGELGNGDLAATHLIRFATQWPELINDAGRQQVSFVFYGVEDDSQQEVDLLQALFDAGWDHRPASASGLWSRLAELRLQRGEIALAKAVIAHIEHPVDVRSLIVDSRFAAVVGDLQPDDVVARGQGLLEKLRVSAANSPRDLESQVELIELLLVLGDHAEAIDRTQSIVDDIDAASAAKSLYHGMHLHAWLRNHLATALIRTEQTDAGLKYLEQASHIDEDGESNTSQVLNLASLYRRTERPALSLQTLSRVGLMSDHGRLIEAETRHAVALQLGDSEMASDALDYVRDNQQISPSIYVSALLEAGEEEQAAAIVIDNLRDPGERLSALMSLQSMRLSPELAGDRRLRAGWQALREREDIRKAVAPFGVIRYFDVYDG